MVFKLPPRRVVTTVEPQPRSLEDAVLTLIGERELETDEVTEPGAPSPDWGRLEQVDRAAQTRAPRPPRAGTAIHFAPRRSPHELPWSTFDEVLPSTR